MLSAASIDRARAAMESGWIGQGPQTRAFESALAERLGARNCVAVSSGTAALHVALVVLDLSPGAEVVTTPMTWIATHHVIEYVGCRPILADVDPTTGNIDPASVAARIGERTEAIVVVHYSGYPCDLEELRAIADRHRLPLVEDAAQAMGATYHGKPVGAGENLQTLSFGPTKNLTTIHGGAVMTADDAQADRLRALRNLGQSRGTRDRMLASGSSYRESYERLEVGFRYDLPDVHAAVGLGQLTSLDADNARRAAIAALYADELADVSGLELPARGDDRSGANHFFPLLVERRSYLAQALGRRGVDVSVHYPLNPLLDSQAPQVPAAAHFAARTLTLPLHPSLTDEQLEQIVEAVRAGW